MASVPKKNHHHFFEKHFVPILSLFEPVYAIGDNFGPLLFLLLVNGSTTCQSLGVEDCIKKEVTEA